MTARRRPSPARALVLTWLLATVACGNAGRSRETTRGDCLRSQADIADGPVIAVLTGITAADKSAELAADRERAFQTILRAGVKTKARLMVDIIGSGLSDGFLAVNAPLAGEGQNSGLRKINANCKRIAAEHRFHELFDRGGDSPIDVLTALNVLSDHLHGVPTGRRIDVVLMSSMLNGTPVLRLADARQRERNPYDLFEDVHDRGVVPDCRDWNVSVIGGGRTPDGGLEAPAAARMKDFWALFFHRCGGRLVAYQTQLTQFPLGDASIDVPAPPVEVLGDDASVITAKLPGNVLFDTAKADIRPDAEAAMNELLALARRYDRRPITVGGHTDSLGSPERNQELSERRAAAVAQWLVAHQVPKERITVIGFGSQRPVASNEDPGGRQQNRRVEVSFTGGER